MVAQSITIVIVPMCILPTGCIPMTGEILPCQILECHNDGQLECPCGNEYCLEHWDTHVLRCKVFAEHPATRELLPMVQKNYEYWKDR